MARTTRKLRGKRTQEGLVETLGALSRTTRDLQRVLQQDSQAAGQPSASDSA
jgi:hypothetical protein